MTPTSILQAPRVDPGSRPLSARRLSATALRALLVRTLGPVSAFLLAMVLARSLGAAGSGNFFVALTLVTAISIIAKFGLETALQRFVGAGQGRGCAPSVVGVYRQAVGISLALAVSATGLALALATPIAGAVLNDPAQAGTVRLLGLLIVPYTWLGVHAAMLKALGRPAWGGFFEAAAWPLLTLALAGLAMLEGPLSARAIAFAYLMAALLAAAAAWSLVRDCLPRRIQPVPLPARTLYRSCLSLTGVELMNYALLWTPFMLLPALADAGEAGLYNVAHRLAAQLGLLMLVIASIASARFAAHHQQRQQDDLRRLAGRATRTLILFGLPPAVVLWIWGEAILSLFGAEFAGAGTALRILVAGQLVNLATGPVGYLLAMTGHERTLRSVLLATLGLMLPLALILIPVFGANGAAAAVSLAMAFHNLVCCRLVARRVGLPSVLAFAR
jgi:O-antigen/teichoic acid export membrane protein